VGLREQGGDGERVGRGVGLSDGVALSLWRSECVLIQSSPGTTNATCVNGNSATHKCRECRLATSTWSDKQKGG
jgi:hypothetical protein